MEPASFRAELLRHGVDEGGSVVVGRPLDLGHAFGRGHGDARADRANVAFGDRTNARPALECRQLDVEPAPELALVRPDPRHGRSGVARNHRYDSRLRGGEAGYGRVMGEIEREHRQVARGRDEATPVKALAGVWVIVAAVATLVIVVGIVIWLVLA